MWLYIHKACMFVMLHIILKKNRNTQYLEKQDDIFSLLNLYLQIQLREIW